MSSLRRWLPAERDLDRVHAKHRKSAPIQSVDAIQFSLRFSLPIFAVICMAIYIAMFCLESQYEGIAPYESPKLGQKCLSTDDEFINMYMGYVRKLDFGLCVLVVIPCFVFGLVKPYQKVHWLISSIMIIRFILLITEIIHISSFKGDTQLHYLIMVYKGQCKIQTHQMASFRAFVINFTLRIIKYLAAVNMGLLAYGNSVIVKIFTDESKSANRDGPPAVEEYPLANLPRNFQYE